MKNALLTGVVGIALAAMGASQAVASISAGCAAVNAGGFNTSVTNNNGNPPVPAVQQIAIAGFVIGDQITFNITVNPAATGTFELNNQNGITVLSINASTTQTFTVSAAVQTELTEKLVASDNGTTVSVTATCSISQSQSQNLRAVQLAVTKTVAANSGAAITGAVDSAISDAFSATGGTPITFGPNGFTMNFAAEPQSEVARRTDEAFSALGYQGNVYNYAGSAPPAQPPAPPSLVCIGICFYSRDPSPADLTGASPALTKAPPASYDREWSAWADVRGTGFDQNNAASDMHGTQINVTGGIGRMLAPDLLVGIFTGYEHFNFSVESLDGRMTGDGATVGSYAAYQFAPHWRADGMIGWSYIWYNGAADGDAGAFNGSRWLASGGLTGDYRVAVFVLEPSARIYSLWESDNAWTDTLGFVQAARDFSESRISTGGKVIYPWQAGGGVQISPYVGLYSDYRFSSDSALPVAASLVGIQDGWSARVTSGLTFTTPRGGPSVSLGGELGGIGAGYDLWSANARVSLPF